MLNYRLAQERPVNPSRRSNQPVKSMFLKRVPASQFPQGALQELQEPLEPPERNLTQPSLLLSLTQVSPFVFVAARGYVFWCPFTDFKQILSLFRLCN